MVAFHQPNPWGFPMYQAVEDLFQSGAATAASSGTDGGGAHQPETLLNNLAVVKDKVQQVHYLVNLVVAQSAPGSIQHESLGMVASDARNLIQDLIVAASSMLCAFQQLVAAEGDDVALSTAKNEEDVLVLPHLRHEGHHIKAGGFMALGQAHAHEAFHTVLHDDALYSYGSGEGGDKPGTPPLLAGTAAACEIIEIDAANLLAKYTHYCQVCGKGFKRDANLRMHMRAHGDEYKTNAALANRTKGGGGGGGVVGQEAAVGGSGRKYSCPQDGCRWNKNHAKFQPLKSMICVKNHYKRSHCPKMYVCNRCNCKQFAVLSDLRTHEKHCGDLKWMCSCGTTFSRKDKLMGHVALFVGHSPVVNCFTK